MRGQGAYFDGTYSKQGNVTEAFITMNPYVITSSAWKQDTSTAEVLSAGEDLAKYRDARYSF
jgi:hypothetical protein